MDELKLLFNNIKRYYQKISDTMDVNELLEEHFDRYKEQIVDTIYYPCLLYTSYADKIYIANDCIFPEDWTIDDLMGKHRSRPYNPEKNRRCHWRKV